VFCAPNETLVQGINDANKMGQAFVEPFHVSNGLGLDKGEVLNTGIGRGYFFNRFRFH